MTELTNLYMGMMNPAVRQLLLSWQAQSSSSDATVEQQRQEHLRTEVVQVLLFSFPCSMAQFERASLFHSFPGLEYECYECSLVWVTDKYQKKTNM